AVVVGPNGSGKSNVSDAIVWAAGSLTPSELRAEKPDDVLFGGGGDRPAAAHCEVELVFDNGDGGFGEELDFSEVSITRRLARGGEGQYLVNRAAVRRTDLVELLADVGLGGSMHSIVSQGKVDAVLASKPEDRRALVEEAAGLGKFKRRRHRAELKLARVATQVERARDVEDEVRKRLRPLALQATAAERAEKLAVEIAALRARVAQLDLDGIAERRAAADDRRQAAAIARRSTQDKLQSVLADRERAETELSDAAGGRERALGALYRLQGADERLALRRESADALSARLADDLDEAERALSARSDEALRALEDAANVAAAESRDAAVASGRADERARDAHARLATIVHRLAAAAAERLERLRAERTVVEAALSEAAGGQAGANRSLVALGRARERLSGRRENASGLVERLRQEHAEARALADRGGPTPAQLEAHANETQAHARSAASERDDLAERARTTRDRLAALERSLAEREGVSPAARVLAEAGERLALAEIDVEPGSERAVTAALGWRASALLAADPSAGLALLRRAQTEGLGSLVVLAGRDPRTLIAELPVVALDALLEARTQTVTAEGFGYDPTRGELWFAGETAEGVLLELEARRRTLADEADELDSRAGSAAIAAADAATAAREAEQAYAAVAHLRDRVVDDATLGRLVVVVAGLVESLARAGTIADRVEQPLVGKLAVDATRSTELGDELRRLAGLEGEAQRELAEATRRAQEAEVVVARLGGAIDVAVSSEGDPTAVAAAAAGALAAAEAERRTARDASDRARAADAALVARAPRRTGLDADLVRRLVATAASLTNGLDRAGTLASRFEAPVRARADAGGLRASELGAELRRLGAAEVELRQESDRAAERITTVEVELARLEAETEEAGRRLVDAASDEPAEGDDREELTARAARLEARRETLGRVNPLAQEEYDAEKERLEELATQRADLERSLAELEKLRDELAETVTRRFDETFAAVAANFEDVAGTLFPGGEGRLRLVEADEGEGESGIEVELRPAGKKITRLTLLSGGEKALGAISFLFALFLAKPCPFYLLDEVEAALDDANIGRFVERLRRYADRAQFVVITHQKRTMEAADVLYGVTMGDDGVSQIVSRRLPREAAAAATA
ncbi:MAG: chromosome segregation SMC family protein, partial [Gaiella sp.]